MTYRFLHGARVDFDLAINWYDGQLPGLGDQFIDEVYATIWRVVALPHSFSRKAGAPRGREVRVVKVDRFDFLVIYEVTSIEIFIVAIPHARSIRQSWRRRLPPPPTP